MLKADLIKEVAGYLDKEIPDGDVDFDDVPDVNAFIEELGEKDDEDE